MSKQKKEVPAVVLMGVSGCGKSTTQKLLVEKLGVPMAEGDEYHPSENVEKMRSGVPLNDEDRGPWLLKLSEVLADWVNSGSGGVMTCSALKRSYRDTLRGNLGISGKIRFFHLTGGHDLIEDRLNNREDHYMPPGLLDSQFETLELPEADENIVAIPVTDTPEQVAHHILSKLER